MNNLRTQMAALMQGIASSASERGRVVSDIKAQTADTLRAFGHERMAMAKALKSGLVAGRVSRSADVLAIRDNASAMCTGFHQDHGRMRHSLRRSLIQSREAVVSSVTSLCVEFSKDRADFAKVLRHTTKAQRAELGKDRRHRSHAVAGLMRAFSKAHRHMAKAQRAGLAKGRRDRAHTMTGLMQDFHVSRRNMANELAHSLAESRQGTKTHVSGLTWPGATLLKTSEHVHLPAQISARGHEPEKGETEQDQEKATLGEAVRHLVTKTWKSKKK